MRSFLPTGWSPLVERLLHASMVRFAIEDPTSADARWCFNQYFAELNRRFEKGFDLGLSISAGPQELTLPTGLLLLARLHGPERSSFINEGQRN